MLSSLPVLSLSLCISLSQPSDCNCPKPLKAICDEQHTKSRESLNLVKPLRKHVRRAGRKQSISSSRPVNPIVGLWNATSRHCSLIPGKKKYYKLNEKCIDSTIFILSLMGGHLKSSFLSKRLMLDIFIPLSRLSKAPTRSNASHI